MFFPLKPEQCEGNNGRTYRIRCILKELSDDKENDTKRDEDAEKF